MQIKELFHKMWDAPYKHGEKYSGSYAIWYEDNTIFVSFQQTVQKQDWKQNFKIWSKKIILGSHKFRVPAGFVQQYNELLFYVINDLFVYRKEYPKAKKIVFCGWSQGAVLASLMYKSIYASDIPSKCILFGMPNFLSRQSVKTWDSIKPYNVIEFQHSCDLFTYLPPFYTKPDSHKVIFGEPFNLFKAVFGIRKYHTSYIDCIGVDSEFLEV